jgi:hypothetical protein
MAAGGMRRVATEHQFGSMGLKVDLDGKRVPGAVHYRAKGLCASETAKYLIIKARA